MMYTTSQLSLDVLLHEVPVTLNCRHRSFFRTTQTVAGGSVGPLLPDGSFERRTLHTKSQSTGLGMTTASPRPAAATTTAAKTTGKVLHTLHLRLASFIGGEGAVHTEAGEAGKKIDREKKDRGAPWEERRGVFVDKGGAQKLAAARCEVESAKAKAS